MIPLSTLQLSSLISTQLISTSNTTLTETEKNKRPPTPNMTNNIQVIPFCAPLPQSDGSGVIGTITLRGQSAIIWFGWGDIEPCEHDETLVKERGVGEVARVGNGEFLFLVIQYHIRVCIYLFDQGDARHMF